MALADFSSNLRAAANWLATHSNGTGFADTEYGDVYQRDLSLGFGTASMLANQIYAATRSVGIGANDDIDLAGSLPNFNGETINFTAIKKLIIFNRSSVDGNNLTMGGGPLHTIVAEFGASGGLANLIYPQGVEMKSFPITGFPVVAGTSDVLRIHNSGSTAIDYDIIIIGIG